MLFPKVKKIGLSLGLKRTDNMVLGRVKNAFLRLYDGSNMKVIEMTFPEITDLDKERIAAILKNYKLKKTEWIGPRIVLTLLEAFVSYPTNKIMKIIEELSEYSMSIQGKGRAKCEECGKSENAEAYSLQNGSLFLCDDCQASLNDKLAREKEEQDSIPRNYLQGALGAFIFAIPGILLTAIFFIFLERIAAVSSVLYVFLAIKGYALLKGKMNRIGALIINFMGIVMTCIGVYASYLIMILYQTKSWSITTQILKMPEVIREMRMNIVIALVISSIYIVINTFEMFKKWRYPELKKAYELAK